MTGGGGTQTLPVIIEFIWNILESEALGMLKHCSFAIAPSHLVKLSLPNIL